MDFRKNIFNVILIKPKNRNVVNLASFHNSSHDKGMIYITIQLMMTYTGICTRLGVVTEEVTGSIPGSRTLCDVFTIEPNRP